MFTVFEFANVHSVVNQTVLLKVGLCLKCVAVFFTKADDKVLNILIGIRDLDRVGLDMANFEAVLLDFALENRHEQSSALGDNIVDIARISERVHK